MADVSLEEQFHEAMLGIYEAARSLRPPYNATGFRQMVNEHGGKEAADRLLAKSTPSDGFTELFLRGPENLRISVEYLVLQSPWRELFDADQLQVARRRLIDVGCPLPPEKSAMPTPPTSIEKPDLVSTNREPVPPAVRILPMSADAEFPGKTPVQVQDGFFLGELLARSPAGAYFYRNKGLQAPAGTKVLFQFQNQVIAIATLVKVERFDQPSGAFHGALHFNVDSIRVFNPVGPNVLKQAWSAFSGFSNAPLSLDAERFRDFELLLTGVKIPSPVIPLPEELPPSASLTEGAQVQILVNAYERNPEARRLCIEHYKPICAVCGFDFEVTFGPVAAGYIHVHHRVPISEIGTSYVVDPIHDLIPVCPNCHAVIHLGGCRSIEEVKAMHASTGKR